MAGGFTPEFLEELKYKCDIVEVISQYVPLQKKGGRYFGCCPFHNEKTPSFCVNNGWYHCFGCGASGDVVKFVMEMESVSFYDAVKILADKVGLQLPEVKLDPQYAQKKEHGDVLKQLMRDAARYYRNNLLDENKGKDAREYLHNRGLDDEIAKRYGLGLSLDNESMVGYMRRKGYSLKDLEECGLVGNAQRPYDAFANRIIVPIMDSMSNVIAFGGRIIDGEGPKYLNSSDTPVFKKSRNLFSLNFAKRSEERRLILAEGYMDVIAVNQAGFENVVATLGTALTPEQARLMSQYADEVIIAYDSDGPGQAATQKAINLLGEAGIKTKIIKMEGAKDPDEFIKKFGALRFKQLLDNSDGAINFQLAKCKNDLDIESDTGRVEYLKRCVNVLAAINSPVERSVYVSKVAKEQGISREALDAQINSVIRKKINSGRKQEWTDIRTFSDKRRADPQAAAFPKEYRAERGIIAYLTIHPDDLEYVADRLPADFFATDFNKKLYEKLISGMRISSDFNILSLQSEFSADEMGKITDILSEARQIDINRSAAEDYITTLRNSHEKRASAAPAAALSDDEFLKRLNRLKNEK